MNITQYWFDVLEQNADAMRSFFHPEAKICWHNTNEQFSVEEFIRANCEYPGDWDGEIEKQIVHQDLIITVTHVCTKDRLQHFHVTSFIQVENEKIRSIDEYWGDDGPAPKWRLDLSIGQKIKEG